jgi:hypothetical protein
MTGRIWCCVVALGLAGCHEWDPPSDAVTGGEPQAPPLRHVTPAGLPPMFLPEDVADRCRTVCLRYEECFGPAIDIASCESLCASEGWVATARDLACHLSNGCSELWMCHGE